MPNYIHVCCLSVYAVVHLLCIKRENREHPSNPHGHVLSQLDCPSQQLSGRFKSDLWLVDLLGMRPEDNDVQSESVSWSVSPSVFFCLLSKICSQASISKFDFYINDAYRMIKGHVSECSVLVAASLSPTSRKKSSLLWLVSCHRPE